MTPQEYFEIWAPSGGVWSPWAKPVLFTQLDAPMPCDEQLDKWKALDVRWAPTPREHVAIIVDLPGASSIATGLALALRGYRPVPLYNGVPHTAGVVDTNQIVLTLLAGTNDLHAARLPLDAPPVFLLDASRQSSHRSASPGAFDNRWLVFPQDFPSARFLASHGIASVVLVQANRHHPRDDLAHVLLRWQRQAMPIHALSLERPDLTLPLQVSRPMFFGAFWYRALALLRLRRNSAGGFGGVVPQTSESGGFRGGGFRGGGFRGGFG